MVQQIAEEEAIKIITELVRRNLLQHAKEKTREYLQLYPDCVPLRAKLAKVSNEMKDYFGAAEIYEALLSETPEAPFLLASASQNWMQAGDNDKAIIYVERLLKVTKSSDDARFLLANIYERSNKIESSLEIVGEIDSKIAESPRWMGLQARLLIQKKQFPEAIDLIKRNLEHLGSEANPDEQVEALFLLCKVYDRLGEYDKAWTTAEKAHVIDAASSQLVQDKFNTQFDEVKEMMTKDTLDSLCKGPKHTSEPLFIIGNPRSGTSLMEQILSMHPDVANGGEMTVSYNMQMDLQSITDSFLPWPYNLVDMREDDVATLAEQYYKAVGYFGKDKKIVSNKSLGLHTQIGFLSVVLPSSRALFLHRHPLDNCVSCYTTNLLASGHKYINTLETLGNTWVKKREMVDFWLENLQIPTMELHYEDLVENQKFETKRILDFLEVPWEEKCLEFHKSKFVARTISYDQVNKKMYKTSKGRWKNYEKHLGPLIDILGDYL